MSKIVDGGQRGAALCARIRVERFRRVIMVSDEISHFSYKKTTQKTLFFKEP